MEYWYLKHGRAKNRATKYHLMASNCGLTISYAATPTTSPS